jgi:hypothetical protein
MKKVDSKSVWLLAKQNGYSFTGQGCFDEHRITMFLNSHKITFLNSDKIQLNLERTLLFGTK